MEHLRQRDLRRILDFLRESYVLRDSDGFVAHLIAAIPALVPSDFTSYVEMNPRRRRVVQVSHPSELVSAETDRLFERYMHENPLVAHYRRRADGRAMKISDFMTQRQLHRTALHNEFHRRLGGIEYQIAFTFPARRPLVVGVGLNRDGSPDFSERDRLVLNLLRPHLLQAYGNAVAVSQMRADLALLLAGREAEGRGLRSSAQTEACGS